MTQKKPACLMVITGELNEKLKDAIGDRSSNGYHNHPSEHDIVDFDSFVMVNVPNPAASMINANTTIHHL